MEKAEETKIVIEPNSEEIHMEAMTLISAGYSYIYDRKTGERSKTNNNMLPMQLQKKNPDGSLRFTTKKPPFEPKRGAYKCLLHADDPNRAHYTDMGLPVCKKHNLINPHQRTIHMQKRHKVEWAAIEAERIERERQEDREFQRSIMGMAKPQAPLYVSDKEKKK